MTTYLEAAHEILKEAGQPLHYKEITERALEQGLIQPGGLTPDATMGSRLYTDIKQEGSLFNKTGRGMFGLVDWEPSGIEEQVQQINIQTRMKLLELMHTMSGERFELLIMELLLAMGFDESTLFMTPYSGDGGIDVSGVYRAAGLADVNAAVQAKRWKGNVHAPVVTQLRGSLQVHQQGIIITTSDFSKGARKEASAPNKTRIGLISGKDLLELLVKYRVGVVEKTLNVVSLDDEWWGELIGVDEIEALIAPPTDPPTTTSIGKPPNVGEKTIRCELLGNAYTTSTWKELLVSACAALAEHHGDDFAPAAFTIKGKKRQYIAPTADDMIRPVQIPGTELWVEANQSSKSVVRLIERLLVALGHNAEDISIQVNSSN